LFDLVRTKASASQNKSNLNNVYRMYIIVLLFPSIVNVFHTLIIIILLNLKCLQCVRYNSACVKSTPCAQHCKDVYVNAN
jgi:hypothetical protein